MGNDSYLLCGNTKRTIGMWNIILMMVEAFDTNQKKKGGEEKKSEKLLKMFICHIIIVPVSFYSFLSVLSMKSDPNIQCEQPVF
jgi:hypothetical protein